MKSLDKANVDHSAKGHTQLILEKNLYEAGEEAPLRITRIKGNRSLRQQLTQIGIQSGDMICIKRRVPFGGALMIENRGSIIALSRGFAIHILVENWS
jgi:Fe2+ transport system protein FeoA